MTFGLLRGICEAFFPENRPQTKPECDRPTQAPCNPGYGYRPPAGGYGCPPPPAGGYGPCPPPAGGGGYGHQPGGGGYGCPPGGGGYGPQLGGGGYGSYPPGVDPNRKVFHLKGNEIGNNESDTEVFSKFGNSRYNGQNPNDNTYFGVEGNHVKNNKGKVVGFTDFGNLN